MAKDDKRRKLEKQALKEQSDAYKDIQKQLDEIYKKKIKEGKSVKTQTKEEKELKEKMFKLEKDHLKHVKSEKDAEAQKNDARANEAKAYGESRIKQIDESIDKESEFWSMSGQLSAYAHNALKAGDTERFKLSNSLADKAIEQANNEKQIGTEKYTNIDHSSRINDLAREEVVLRRELSMAEAVGDKSKIATITRQMQLNEHESESLTTMQKSAEVTNRRHEIITSGLAPLEAMQKKMQGFADIVEGLVSNPMVLLVTLAVALVAHFKATEESFENFRKNMGLSVNEAGKLQDQAMGVAKNMASSGVSLDDALGATESLVKEFGDMGMATEQNLETVLRMNKALGMSNDEAAKFLHSMTSIMGTTVEEAEALAAGATNLARQADVAPQQVISDMSANADNFAAYIKDGGKNLAEAAVFAAKMGTSISTLVSMADNLLDIESSVEAQMEAQVLLGRHINLEKARQLAYDGDIAGMAAEISKQVGTAAEYEAMKPHQRKALAKAMGMEQAELGKMISKQETLQGLADGTLSTQQALADLPLSEVMDAKGITSGITDIQNSIKAIALNLMEIFRPVFTFVGFILKPIAKALGMVAYLINNPIGKGLLYLYGIYKLMNSQILQTMALKAKDFAKDMSFAKIKATMSSAGGGMKDKVKGMFSMKKPDMPKVGAKSKGAGGFMQSIGKIDMNKVLKGAAAMVVVSAALFVFAKALKELPTTPASYIGAAVGLGMLTGSVYLMGKMQGDLLKGSAALMVMGIAFIPFAFGMSLLANVSWEGVIASAAALVIFTAAIFGLGLLMSSGAGAIIFGAGLLAFAALGAVLIIFGAGLMMAGQGATLLSDSLTGIAIGIIMLTEVTGGVFTMAAALGALSLGFVSLAGSLLLLTPFMPLLLLLGASGVIGQILGTAEPVDVEQGGGKEKAKGNRKRESVEVKLLQAIHTNINGLRMDIAKGGTVNMDGKKVGEVIGGAGTLGPLVG